jgi:hypothetical protein
VVGDSEVEVHVNPDGHNEFRDYLKFAFNLLSAAHCQIPRLLGRDIDRKADQTAWIALGISQERKTEVNGRCNMRSHVPSQKPVLRLSSRTEFS